MFDNLCSQSESGQANAFSAEHFPFGPQKRAFYRGKSLIGPRILITMQLIIDAKHEFKSLQAQNSRPAN